MSQINSDIKTRLFELRKSGKTYRMIADKLGLTASNVAYHCNALGINTPKKKRNQANYAKGTPFSDSEIKTVQTLMNQSHKPYGIAQHMNRPVSSVTYWVNRLKKRPSHETSIRT